MALCASVIPSSLPLRHRLPGLELVLPVGGLPPPLPREPLRSDTREPALPAAPERAAALLRRRVQPWDQAGAGLCALGSVLQPPPRPSPPSAQRRASAIPATRSSGSSVATRASRACTCCCNFLLLVASSCRACSSSSRVSSTTPRL